MLHTEESTNIQGNNVNFFRYQFSSVQWNLPFKETNLNPTKDAILKKLFFWSSFMAKDQTFYVFAGNDNDGNMRDDEEAWCGNDHAGNDDVEAWRGNDDEEDWCGIRG